MKKVVFTFGRMNPITLGHQRLVRKVKDLAKKDRADAHVYLSHTQDQKKNPLNYNQKVKYAKSAFGNIVKQSNDKTVINILKSLQKNYSDVVMVVGSDRVNEFKKLLDKYNGKDFKFDTVNVVSSGKRDPDAEGVEGMSASKMRELAKQDNYTDFKMGLPNLREPAMLQIFKDVKKGMGMQEQIEEETDFDVTDEELDIFIETIDLEEDDKDYIEERAPMTIMQRIKRGRQMKRLAPRFKRLRKIRKFRMAPLKRLQFRARQAALKFMRKRIAGKKGENYRNLPASQKIAIDKMVQKRTPMIDKMTKRLMPKVRKAEMIRLQNVRKNRSEDYDPSTSYLEYIAEVRQDQDIKDKEGTQPAKYFKGLKKSTKDKRDAHFKKHGAKDDDDASAYKPAPGDARAKTKLSKYTKQYRAMYGEAVTPTPEVTVMEPQVHYNTAAAAHKEDKKYPYQAAITDLDLNTKNRNETIKEYAYGPANPGAPDEITDNFWRQKADLWGCSTDMVKTMRCYNCNAFDQKTATLDAMAKALGPDGKKIVEGSNLGFCEFFEFKCAGERVCDAWVGGGPLKEQQGENMQEDIPWYQKAKDKIHQMLHPKGYRKILQMYLDLMKKGDPNPIAKIGQTVRGVDARDVRFYINGLIKKGKLPRAMMAQDEKPHIVRSKKHPGELRRMAARPIAASEEYITFSEQYNTDYLSFSEQYEMNEARGRKGGKEDEEKDTENIIMQLRKSISLRGLKRVKFDDGGVVQVKATDARKALDKYDSIRMNDPKYKYMRSLSKSPQSFKKALNASTGVPPDMNPIGPAAFDKYRMSYISANRNRSSISPRSNYQIEAAIQRVRDSIKQEKEADKVKHDRMRDRARLADVKAKNKVTEEKSAKVKDALKKKSEKSKVPYGVLSKVFNRGLAAYKTGHRPGTSPHQWAFARVNSYISKGKGTYHGADKDLRETYEVGTSPQDYVKGTPGQDYSNLVAQIKNINKSDCQEKYEELQITEAEYQGKKVKLNDPIRTSENPNKKFKVYVKDPSSGNIKVVRFGDPGLSIKRDDPKRRKSFRARHNCDNPGPITGARYWSCYQWRSGSKVDN